MKLFGDFFCPSCIDISLYGHYVAWEISSPIVGHIGVLQHLQEEGTGVSSTLSCTSAGLQAIVEDCNAQLEAASASGADPDTLREELGDAEAELAILAESHGPQTLQDAAPDLATFHGTSHLHPGLESQELGPPGHAGGDERDPAEDASTEPAAISREHLPGQSEALSSNSDTRTLSSLLQVFRYFLRALVQQARAFEMT